MAVDRSGNIYIITAGNSRIRKIDQTGTITTIAGIGQSGFAGDGGPATSAKLDWPSGIAVDIRGNIFFTEFGNCLVRKVDPSGIITTVAGNGHGGYSGDGGPATAASLFWPVGLAVDAIGNIYISDTTNHRIRKVDAKGIISTLAGTGQMSYGGDGLPPGQASFSFPRGVAVDDSGNIYINDSENSRIRKISYPEAFQASITAGELVFVDKQDIGYILILHSHIELDV